MSDLTELFAVDSKQVLMFFFGYLENGIVLGATQAETLYVASILAHYALTSRTDTSCMPPAGNLHEVLEMLPEDGEPALESEFVDVRTIQVA